MKSGENMSKSLIIKNMKTGEQKIFTDVHNLIIPNYETKSFRAIFDLADKQDVKAITFNHSDGEFTFSTAMWTPIHLKG